MVVGYFSGRVLLNQGSFGHFLEAEKVQGGDTSPGVTGKNE